MHQKMLGVHLYVLRYAQDLWTPAGRSAISAGKCSLHAI